MEQSPKNCQVSFAKEPCELSHFFCKRALYIIESLLLKEPSQNGFFTLNHVAKKLWQNCFLSVKI